MLKVFAPMEDVVAYERGPTWNGDRRQAALFKAVALDRPQLAAIVERYLV